jgi:hypothetical protein
MDSTKHSQFPQFVSWSLQGNISTVDAALTVIEDISMSEIGIESLRISITNFGRMNGTGKHAVNPQFGDIKHFDAVKAEAHFLFIFNFGNPCKRGKVDSDSIEVGRIARMPE